MAQASAEKLEHTRPAEKERVASVPRREQLTSTPESSLSKGKEQSRLFRVPDRKQSIQCQGSKESSSKGKKKRQVFLCRRTVKIKVKSKVITTSFLKIEERGTLIGAKDRRKRDCE